MRVGAEEHGSAEGGRFQKVVATHGHQASPHEGDASEAVDPPKLAKGVQHEHVVWLRRPRTASVLRTDLKPLARAEPVNRFTQFDPAGRKDQAKSREEGAEFQEDVQEHLFLARMGAACHDEDVFRG